ncbi:MAG: hypothetical protein LBN10_02540 [Propionibacteriaceae bacterium]|jgi:secretion/DNA translocation related CpaE-like protein|nr:hypothetical protein [Propionibacteriaceae bacterium]
MNKANVVLVSEESALIRAVEVVAATGATTVLVAGDESEVRAAWRNAGVVLVGEDMAGRVGGWGLSRRAEVFLVGVEPSQELCRWSIPLDAAVVALSQGSASLAGIIAGRSGDEDRGVVVAVRAASGGVGASTLAAGMCLAAVARGRSAALVDGDPRSGGIDLLMGAEKIPGWRWPKLASAQGHVADITSMLPVAAGVTILSCARREDSSVSAVARRAVVGALSRHRDLVVVDAGRVEDWRDVAGVTVLVSDQSIRSVAAGVELAWDGHVGLAVRREGNVGAAGVAKALGLPLVATVPTVKSLAQMADGGVPPDGGRAWRKACATVVDWAMGVGRGD